MLTLQSIYSELKGLKCFWHKDECFPYRKKYSRKSFTSNLTFKTAFGEFPNQLVKVTYDRISFKDRDGNVWTCKTKWALVSSFIEIRIEDPVYGFTVRFNEVCEQDFFVSCEEELNCWLEVLAQYAVLTDLENDFIVIREIDSGNYGSVKLCEDIKTREKFALKQLKKSELQQLRVINQLFNEISLLRKLDHKNIIKLYKVYDDETSISLIMEYVPHGNMLKRILSQKKSKEIEIAKFTKKLLKVLKYIHSHGIIHRDLKLENILMTSKTGFCDFKLADFGLACYTDKTLKQKSGSPGYMAPEILRGTSYSTKADIFSAGIILYILYTYTSPFSETNQEKTIEKNLKCEISFENKEFRSIKRESLQFLQLLLETDATLRPNAEQALRILDGKYGKFAKTEKKGKVGFKESTERVEYSFDRLSSRFIIFK